MLKQGFNKYQSIHPHKLRLEIPFPEQLQLDKQPPWYDLEEGVELSANVFHKMSEKGKRKLKILWYKEMKIV